MAATPVHVLAIDQGTTSTRAILFDRDGLPVATRAAGVAADLSRDRLGRARPRGDLARHRRRLPRGHASRPASTATRHRRHRHHQPARDHRRCGTGQTGEPLHNAIVWQDRRTARRLRGGCTATAPSRWSRRKTGLLLDPYFSGTKLAGCSTTCPAPAPRAERGELRFGTIDSLLLWRLTGGSGARDRRHQRLAHAAVRHPHGATGTRSCCELFDIPRAMLPEVTRLQRPLRRDRAGAASARPIPIAGVAGDQQAATVRPGLLRARHVKITYGTGCFVLLNTGDQAGRARSNRLLTTVA